MFDPAKKFNVLQSTPGADLLNPFRTERYEDQEGEETHNGMSLHAQSNSPIPPVPNMLELEELVDNENMLKKGMESLVDMGDGKHLHSKGFA